MAQRGFETINVRTFGSMPWIWSVIEFDSSYEIEVEAAEGLAEIGEKGSIPFIIDACKKVPAEPAALIARSLVYFDDPEAQSAVDRYIPKDIAKTYRDAKARGKKTPYTLCTPN